MGAESGWGRARLPRSLSDADHLIARDAAGALLRLPAELEPEGADAGREHVDHLSHAYAFDRPHLARAWVRAIDDPGGVHSARAWIRVGDEWVYRRHDYCNLVEDPAVGCVVIGVSDIDPGDMVRPSGERGLRPAEARWAILRIGRLGEIMRAEGTVVELYGRSADDLVGTNGLDIVHPDDHPLLLEAWTDVVERGAPGRALRQRVVHADGTATWVLTSIGHPDADGNITIHDLDITEQLAAEEALRASEGKFRRLAATDDLTGLPNRPALTLELQRRSQSGIPTTVAFIDLDGFKSVNDAHGHDEGDQVLQRVGSALVGLIRDDDIAGRWGGDEFLLVLDELPPDAQHDLRARVRTAMAACGAGGASVGFTSLGSADDVRAVIDRADQAMYDDKQR